MGCVIRGNAYLSRMRTTLVTLLAFSLCLSWLSACRPGHSPEHIRAVDSLIVVIQAEKVAVSQLDSISLAAAGDSVQSQLAFIQTHYKALLPSHVVKELDAYAHAGKMTRQPLSVLENLRRSVIEEEKQLLALKEALDKGATHDAQGNEMSPAYMAERLTKEKETVKRITEERDHWQVAARSIMQKWNELYPNIKSMVDSLKAQG